MTTSETNEAAGHELADVALVEPVRQRLVTIASDVLGRLPADQVPASLRPIARFTPNRRMRLGATALAGALDRDEQFRAKVAETVAEASPDLAEALRDRRPVAASDPVDVAVVAYLLRPTGWQDEVAAAIGRWRSEREQAGVEAATAELDEARAEVAQLRTQLRSQEAQAKSDIATARDESAEEINSLRRQLRARTGELRAAERARDDALAAAEAATRQREAAESARDNEIRRLRARIVEIERGIDTARRSARADRELDDARLWLLVQTVTDAAAGIRRELSLSTPTTRPADVVGSAQTAGFTHRLTSVAHFDKVLGLPNVHVIVDGYNVTKSGYGELTLADQRSRLIKALAPLATQRDVEVTIAFDGSERPTMLPPTPRGVRVLFSAADEIADDLIRRLVAAEPAGRPIVVVSSDQQVAADIRRSGAWSAPSDVLLQRLARN